MQWSTVFFVVGIQLYEDHRVLETRYQAYITNGGWFTEDARMALLWVIWLTTSTQCHVFLSYLSRTLLPQPCYFRFILARFPDLTPRDRDRPCYLCCPVFFFRDWYKILVWRLSFLPFTLTSLPFSYLSFLKLIPMIHLGCACLVKPAGFVAVRLMRDSRPPI